MNKPANQPYLTFISDEDLFECIEEVYSKYKKEFEGITYKDFVNNKLDPIKMFFDMRMRNLNEQEWIMGEISRQVDRSISNAIGSFHEHIISKMSDLILDKDKNYGIDLYNEQKTMFVEVKNKHNTLKGEDKKAVFAKLEALAIKYEEAKCYFVTIIDKKSKEKEWSFIANVNKEPKNFHHCRVIEITADNLYYKLTGDPNSFKDFCEALPNAINEFLLGKEEELIDQKEMMSKRLLLSSEMIEQAQMRGWDLETFLCDAEFSKSKYRGFTL